MLIMSISAEPFAEASTTFERQLVAIADRFPDRRASHTATPTHWVTAPSKIHSHRSEEQTRRLPPETARATRWTARGRGATADAVTVGWTVEREGEGLGDLAVPGENVGGEDGSVVGVGGSAGAVSDGGAAE